LETGWASPLHPLLLELLLARLLGVQVDMNSITPVHPEHVAESLATPMQRSKLVVPLVLLEMVCRPIPAGLQESVEG
jgi:hypothetical protein